MPTRRAILVVAIAGGLAGCLSDDDNQAGDDDDDGVDYTGPMVGETELRHNYPVVFEDPETEDRVVEIHYHQTGAGEWHFQPLTVGVDETRELVIRLYDHEAERLPVGEEGGYELSPTSFDNATVALSIAGDVVIVEGVAPGETEGAFDVIGPEGGRWTTPSLPIVVEE